MHGQPLTPHEWLAEVAYGASYLLLGMNGVVLLAALLISITVYLVYREILRRGVPRLIAFLLVLWCAAMTSPHWLARPHLFTFLFIAIWTPLAYPPFAGGAHSFMEIPPYHDNLGQHTWSVYRRIRYLGNHISCFAMGEFQGLKKNLHYNPQHVNCRGISLRCHLC